MSQASSSPDAPSDLVPFSIPPYPPGVYPSLAQARVDLPREAFRQHLRRHLLAHPHLTLRQVARELGVSKQAVSVMAGRLNRPNCAQVARTAPRKEEARLHMVDLVTRVRAGEPAEQAAAALGVSLAQATRLGFRKKLFLPPHGTRLRAVGDEGRAACLCWRCRRVMGVALPRGPRTGPARRAQVLDWLAYNDPDTGEGLTQAQIARLAEVHQPLVSRIARAMGGEA